MSHNESGFYDPKPIKKNFVLDLGHEFVVKHTFSAVEEAKTKLDNALYWAKLLGNTAIVSDLENIITICNKVLSEEKTV